MSNYPAQIDTNAELPLVVDGVTETTAEIINSIREAVVAIETALGVSPQGTATDLTTRIANALNPDGTIKSSALPSTLIDLPLNNEDIGVSAAIVESKLNLDVSTQTLQDQITSNDIDIASLQGNLASLLSRYVRHISGLGDRHNATHINHVLSDGYGAGIGTTVATALDYLEGKIETHKQATNGREHYASAIEYDPGTVNAGTIDIITANNVQEAIEEIETSILEQIRLHNDLAHSDGIAADGYVFLSGQAAVNDANLKLTRYQPNSGTDIMKIGLCNAPVVKTKGFRPTEISSLASNFDIQVDIGTNSRTLSITGLENSEYPVGNNRVTLLGIVDYLNAEFANTTGQNHFPVSAFASEDGELVLQMNIARDDAYITIKDPGGSTAIDALGFRDIVDVAVGRVNNYEYVINGTRYTELETLADASSTQGSLSSIVDLGITVDSGGLDLQANSLLHIYDHSTASSVGTYKIINVPSSTSVQLSENLNAGTFSFVIYKDTLNTNAITTNRRVVDFYLDDERNPIVSERGTVVFGGIQGVRIVEISQGFEAFSGSFELATSGSSRGMRLIGNDGYQGPQVLFDPGFIGYLKVHSPDNDSFVTTFVFDVAPVNGTDTLTIIESEFQDDRILLGTSHHNGLSTIEMPLDRRNVGLVGESAIGSEFRKATIESDLDNFHLSGIIRGFEIIDTTTTSVRVQGGTAYIGGKRIVVPSQTINVTNVATTDGTWNLVLDKDGKFDIFEEGDSPLSTQYSVADILFHDNLVLISQLTVSGGNVTATLDLRFFINDIESRLQLTVDNRDLGAGSFRTLEAASLYSQNAPNDTKPEITILSDLTFDTTLTISSGARIVSFGDLTFDANLVLSSNSELICFGNINVAGTVTIGTGAELKTLGSSNIFGNTVTFQNDSSLYLDGYIEATSFSITGSRVNLIGNDVADKPNLEFSSSGISASSVSEILIKDVDIVTTGLNGAISLSGCNNVRIQNTSFAQASISLAQIAQTARSGITIAGTNDHILIERCRFDYLSRPIIFSASSTTSNFFAVDNYFENIGLAIDCSASSVAVTEFEILGNKFNSVHSGAIEISGGDRGVIGYNQGLNVFDVTSAPSVISGNTDRSVINGNIFTSIDGTTIINLTGNQNVISNNVVQGCVTSTYAFIADNNSSIDNNIIAGHDGACVSTDLCSVTGNYFYNDGGSGITAWNFSGSMVSGNYLTNFTTFDSVLNIVNCTFGDNRVFGGSGTVTQNATIVGNELSFTDTGATYSLELSGAGDVIILSGNKLVGSALTSNLRLDRGTMVVTGNSVSGSSGSFSSAVYVDITATSEWTTIANNHIESGAAYGIFVDSDEVIVQGNIVEGAVTGGDIAVGTGRTEVLVTGNIAAGTGGDSRRIFSQDTSHPQVFIWQNMGAQERRTFSPFSATRIGPWTVTIDGIENNVSGGATQRLYVSLNNLPVGTELSSVDVHISNGGGLGAATARLYNRSASSLTAVALSTAQSVPAGAFTSFNVTPTSTVTITDAYEYFIQIEIPSSLGASTIIVGQVVANLIT